jgi:hypothetical protein
VRDLNSNLETDFRSTAAYSINTNANKAMEKVLTIADFEFTSLRKLDPAISPIGNSEARINLPGVRTESKPGII